jgi:hypothetical protein
MDASTILAIGGILTGLLAFVSQYIVGRRTARKDEVTMLREEVSRLHGRVDELSTDNDKWRIKYDNLYTYVLMLRKILVDHNIDVPEMSIFNADETPSPIDATTHPEKKTKQKKIAL